MFSDTGSYFFSFLFSFSLGVGEREINYADRGLRFFLPTGAWDMFPISQRTEMLRVTQKSTGKLFTVEVGGNKSLSIKSWVLESAPLHSCVTLGKKIQEFRFPLTRVKYSQSRGCGMQMIRGGKRGVNRRGVGCGVRKAVRPIRLVALLRAAGGTHSHLP